MNRAFVVESKPVRLMPHPRDPARMRVPILLRGSSSGGACLIPHRRAQRVLEQRMLDVGEQQFLMLLLMRKAQLYQRTQIIAFEQGLHRLVNVLPPGEDIGQGRAGKHSAGKARDPFAFRLVIGIENERPSFVIQRVIGQMVTQQEGFPEPRYMRDVPLGRRRIFHGLEGSIRFGQWLDQCFAQLAYVGEPLCQIAIGHVIAGLRGGHGRSPPLRLPVSGNQMSAWRIGTQV